MKEQNLCILIDFENIAAGTERENLGRFNTKLVMNHLKEKGRVVISRAYGDWGRFAKFKQALLEQGISMMELTSYRGQDKNRADIALVVDAMELVYSRPHIQTFVLLSGDSDFTPLVMKLRELDKRIIGMGTRKATSRLLASSCDEFIFYDNLLKRSHREEESNEETSLNPKPITSQEAFALLVETIKVIQRDEPRPVSAGMVKQFILRKTPTFDETDFGHSGFTDFLAAAAKAELVQLINNDKGGGYLVSIKGTGPIIQKLESPKYHTAFAQTLSEQLIEEGFHPTKHFIRHTVVHEFVDHILERRAKKKRSTLVFTYGDIARRCRKTDPPASTSEVDSILNALYKAGELYGNDQKPIRSKKANFTIKKDAEEMLRSLRRFYVGLLLKKNGADVLSNHIDALCEVLWNDTSHLDETREIIATLTAESLGADDTATTEQSTSKEPPTTDAVTEKESIVESGTIESDTSDNSSQNAKPKSHTKRPTKKTASKKPPESSEDSTSDDQKKTKRKSTAKKTTKEPNKRSQEKSKEESKTNPKRRSTKSDTGETDKSVDGSDSTTSTSSAKASPKKSTPKKTTKGKSTTKTTAKKSTKQDPVDQDNIETPDDGSESTSTSTKATAKPKNTRRTTRKKKIEPSVEDQPTESGSADE